MEEKTISVIGSFWGEFSFGRIYDTGWADIVRSSGATTPLPTREDMLISCAFLNGAAQMVKITQPYMSRSWQIAHQISVFAGFSIAMITSENNGSETAFKAANNIAGKVRDALLKILDTEIDSTIA